MMWMVPGVPDESVGAILPVITRMRALTDVDVRCGERHGAVEPEQRVVDGVATW